MAENAINSIVDTMVENAPPVSEHLDEIRQEETESQVEVKQQIQNEFSKNPPIIPSVVFDDTVFDSSIHSVDANNNPVMRKDGIHYARKRGRKTGTVATIPTTQVGTSERVAIRKAAETMAGLFITTTMGVFGEEWKPKTDPSKGTDEGELLTSAFEEYFATSGTINIPPWAGLCVALGFYSAQRLVMPKTKKRLGDIAGKISQWFGGFFRKKQ